MSFSHKKIRKKFLMFFIHHNYRIISGSSVIPRNDSTLLFVNAGMVQFKNIFLGRTFLYDAHIITIQKCLRVGGKHNDFENIGYTKYHHLFFEMLGNFSFHFSSKYQT